MYHISILLLLIACALILQPPALAAEFVIKEAGVVFDLPDEWTARIEENVIPTGQLMQRWVRKSIRAGNANAMPGMVVVATDIPADASLALVTQRILGGNLYRVKLAVETECIKCMEYRLKMPQGTATTIAPDTSSACSQILKSGNVSECTAKPINLIGLKLEPSWAHRFNKDVEGRRMKVILIHSIVNGKLLDVSFWYPSEVADRIEQEIKTIVASMRVR